VNDGTVGLLLDDDRLASLLRDRLEASASFIEVLPEEAALLVTDVPDTTRGVPILHVGPVAEGRDALRTSDPDLILAALTLLHAGYHIEPQAAEPRLSSGVPHLSPRERQVATLLVDGASNKGIARALGISVHTAKFHVTAILEKLGAGNRADAVAMLLREGLVAI